MHGALPVDLSLHSKCIFMVSKCVCCSMAPDRESIDHLFLRSEIASYIWRALTETFNKVWRYSSIPHLFSVLTNGVSLRSQVGACFPGIFLFTCWEI